MDKSFFDWAQSQPPHIINDLYLLWLNKPRGSELISVQGTYAYKKITAKELKNFAANIDNIFVTKTETIRDAKTD